MEYFDRDAERGEINTASQRIFKRIMHKDLHFNYIASNFPLIISDEFFQSLNKKKLKQQEAQRVSRSNA